MHTFSTPGPTTVVLRAGAGDVTVSTAETDHTTVELTALNAAAETVVANAIVEQRGDSVLVDVSRHRGGLFGGGPRVGVRVTCPHGSSLDAAAGSADLRAVGTYAQATVAAGSGQVELGTVTGEARVKSGSGAVAADHAGAAFAVTTGSGDVVIDTVTGEVVTRTGSGDVEVGRLEGSLLAKTGSGSVTVRSATSGTVTSKGASGDISIGVQEGTAAWLDVSTVSGRVRQELGESGPPEDDRPQVRVSAHTVSGNLRVHRS